jgi:polar amino acid transport system substrate-binding protein
MTASYPCIAFIFTLALYSGAYGSPMSVYVYHDDAPYWVEGELDLSQQWVQEFNQKQSDIQLKIEHIERPALNAVVESGQPYIILWANKLWFKRRDSGVLSSEDIFWDADTLVSLVDNPIDFSRAEQLVGLKIGARSGHFYSDFNPLFKSGRIMRIDSKSSLSNYKMLTQGKIHAFLDSRSTIAYMQKKNIFTGNLYVSLNPQDAYSRHVLVSKHHAAILPLIDKVILEMKNDQAWQVKMEKWGVLKLVNPFELDLQELNEI